MKLTTRLVWFVVAATGVLGGPGGICAAAEQAQGSSMLPEVAGKIIAVDPSHGTLTLERSAASNETPQQMEFLISDETAVVKAGLRLNSSDLRAGDEGVTIQYAPQGTQLAARSVTFEKPANLARTSGTIEAIDLLKGELVLKPDELFSGERRRTCAVNERTVFSQNGERSYLANLRVGDEALIEYAMEGDKAVAYAVTAKTPQRSPSAEKIREQSSGAQRQTPGVWGQTPSKQ